MNDVPGRNGAGPSRLPGGECGCSVKSCRLLEPLRYVQVLQDPDVAALDVDALHAEILDMLCQRLIGSLCWIFDCDDSATTKELWRLAREALLSVARDLESV